MASSLDFQVNGSQPAASVAEEESPAVLAAFEAAVASSQPDAASAEEASPAPLPTLPSVSVLAIPPVSAVYPKLPPLPSSQPTRASQRRAPALSDLSQRSKAEFAVAGSNHGTPNGRPGPKGRASFAGAASSQAAASQPSQGVFGKLGQWLAGSGGGDSTDGGRSSQANGGGKPADDDSDSSSSSESDSSSDDDRLGSKVAKSRLARPALGRKKKSLLGAL